MTTYLNDNLIYIILCSLISTPKKITPCYEQWTLFMINLLVRLRYSLCTDPDQIKCITLILALRAVNCQSHNFKSLEITWTCEIRIPAITRTIGVKDVSNQIYRKSSIFVIEWVFV